MSKSKPTTPKKSKSAKSKTKPVRAKKKELPGDDMFDRMGIELNDVESEKGQLWDYIQVVGHYADLDQMPSTVDEIIDGGLIEDEDRIEELEKGATLTREEREACEERWVEYYFGQGHAPSFGMVKVQGRIVTLLSYGHSFEGLSIMVRGISDSWEQAFGSLDSSGVRENTCILHSDLEESLGKYEN